MKKESQTRAKISVGHIRKKTHFIFSITRPTPNGFSVPFHSPYRSIKRGGSLGWGGIYKGGGKKKSKEKEGQEAHKSAKGKKALKGYKGKERRKKAKKFAKKHFSKEGKKKQEAHKGKKCIVVALRPITKCAHTVGVTR